ncbi:putative ribosome biogenesis protein Nop16 [Arabidopsis thaliana]
MPLMKTTQYLYVAVIKQESASLAFGFITLSSLCLLSNLQNLKTALGKQRKDGKSAPLQPLTTMQRTHIRRLVEKHGDDIEGMYRDRKLNSMQHSVATLRKLCTRYQIYKDKNPILVS